jgi:hypothetical protein
MHMHRQPLSASHSYRPFLPAFYFQPSCQPFFISHISSPKVAQHVSRVIQQTTPHTGSNFSLRQQSLGKTKYLSDVNVGEVLPFGTALCGSLHCRDVGG